MRKIIEKGCGSVGKGEKGYMRGLGRRLALREGREAKKKGGEGTKKFPADRPNVFLYCLPFPTCHDPSIPSPPFSTFTTLFYLSPPFHTHPYPTHSFTTLSYISPSFPTLYHPFSTLYLSFLPFTILFYPLPPISTIHHPFLPFTTLFYPSPPFLPCSLYTILFLTISYHFRILY